MLMLSCNLNNFFFNDNNLHRNLFDPIDIDRFFNIYQFLYFLLDDHLNRNLHDSIHIDYFLFLLSD